MGPPFEPKIGDLVIIRGAGRRHRKGRPQRPLTAIRPLLAKTTARQRRPARP